MAGESGYEVRVLDQFVDVADEGTAGHVAAGHFVDRHFHFRSGYCIQQVIAVIHSISTSNHNTVLARSRKKSVVIHLISTSNHNLDEFTNAQFMVVIHLISTSNHNNLHKRYRFSHQNTDFGHLLCEKCPKLA